jgi:hypothetical protein
LYRKDPKKALDEISMCLAEGSILSNDKMKLCDFVVREMKSQKALIDSEANPLRRIEMLADLTNDFSRIDLVVQGQKIENLRMESLSQLEFQIRALCERNPEQGRRAIVLAYQHMTVYPLSNMGHLSVEMSKSIKSKEEKKRYLLDLQNARKGTLVDGDIDKKINEELVKMENKGEKKFLDLAVKGSFLVKAPLKTWLLFFFVFWGVCDESFREKYNPCSGRSVKKGVLNYFSRINDASSK